MATLTSPVNAPASRCEQCCAPRTIGSASAPMMPSTERRSVNGGWTDTSTWCVSAERSLSARLWIRWMASTWSRFIFQFPATNGVRAVRLAMSAPRCVLRVAERGEGG